MTTKNDIIETAEWVCKSALASVAKFCSDEEARDLAMKLLVSAELNIKIQAMEDS